MYEIFGSEEVVSVRKNTNVNKPHLSGPIPIKGDVNQKMRTLSVGNNKLILGDVSNKVKNTIAVDAKSQLRSLSPCKSIRKPLFSEELCLPSDCSAKTAGLQSNKRDKSPKNLKVPFTPKPTSKRAALGSAKVSIFVDNQSDDEDPFLGVPRGTDLAASDSELDEVFLPTPDVRLTVDSCDTESSPQEIFGFSEGYETPEEDMDGWLLQPMWSNKEELAKMIGFGQSLESEPELSETGNFKIPTKLALDDTAFDNIFAIGDIATPPDDIPLADLEW